MLPQARPHRRLPFPLPLALVITNDHRPAQPASSDELSIFLKNLNVDVSPYFELLKTQGFDVLRLHTFATWSRDEIEEGINRLLMGSGSAVVGRRGMPANIRIKFEIALLALKATPPARVHYICDDCVPWRLLTSLSPLFFRHHYSVHCCLRPQSM
jgi:hypothetical protein